MKWFFAIAAGLVLVAVLFLLAIASGQPSAADADEARTVCSYLVSSPTLAERFDSGGASATWRPGPRRTRLSVYGMLDESDRATVVAVLRSGRAEQGWKPIAVDFFTESIESQDGPVLRRGDGKRLASVTIR